LWTRLLELYPHITQYSWHTFNSVYATQSAESFLDK